jgi:hypothetical protein
MSKTEKVLNIKTGKLENCTVGAGCQRHSHATKEVLANMKANAASVAKSLKSHEKEITVKPYGSNTEEKIVVITPKLFATDRNYDEGFVMFDKDEVRYMDMDELSAALGETLRGTNYNRFEEVVIYSRYAETPTHKIFKAKIETF